MTEETKKEVLSRLRSIITNIEMNEDVPMDIVELLLKSVLKKIKEG